MKLFNIFVSKKTKKLEKALHHAKDEKEKEAIHFLFSVKNYEKQLLTVREDTHWHLRN